MQGAAIELEIWALPSEQVGGFIAGIGAPLGIGKVELESGSVVSGFICEGYALATAVDITAHGGWRGYLRASR
jgi:allophanate hydrolase